MSEKHRFRIVGEEDAIVTHCGDVGMFKAVGIYEDLATECPNCHELLVLRVGHSYIETVEGPPKDGDEA